MGIPFLSQHSLSANTQGITHTSHTHLAIYFHHSSMKCSRYIHASGRMRYMYTCTCTSPLVRRYRNQLLALAPADVRTLQCLTPASCASRESLSGISRSMWRNAACKKWSRNGWSNYDRWKVAFGHHSWVKTYSRTSLIQTTVYMGGSELAWSAMRFHVC